jgi:hypothetical protein
VTIPAMERPCPRTDGFCLIRRSDLAPRTIPGMLRTGKSAEQMPKTSAAVAVLFPVGGASCGMGPYQLGAPPGPAGGPYPGGTPNPGGGPYPGPGGGPYPGGGGGGGRGGGPASERAGSEGGPVPGCDGCPDQRGSSRTGQIWRANPTGMTRRQQHPPNAADQVPERHRCSRGRPTRTCTHPGHSARTGNRSRGGSLALAHGIEWQTVPRLAVPIARRGPSTLVACCARRTLWISRACTHRLDIRSPPREHQAAPAQRESTCFPCDHPDKVS